MQTQILSANDAGLSLSSLILGRGGLVAFPTETVYGLGADARDDAAVARIFAAKGRPSFNPLIVHVACRADATEFAQFSDTANALAAAFWPGPLSLVLPMHQGQLSHLVSAGMPSVAIRVPAHPVAQALLQIFGGPIAAPSANPSGQISPTSPGHVMAGLGSKIDAILDGGLCMVGVESTILGVNNGDQVTLLRPGGISVEQIARVIGYEPMLVVDADTPSSPGQLLSHYAPKAGIQLNVTSPAPDMLTLGFGTSIPHPTLNLSDTGNLVEAAANLFAHLHALDAMAKPNQIIGVAPIRMHGLGVAINDRLTRAAAPRDTP